MKAEFIGEVNLRGVDACLGYVPENGKFSFDETSDMKSSFAVKCDSGVIGYVTGSEYAVIRTFIEKGLELYCEKGNTEEKEEGTKYTLKVYFVPKKI